MADPGRWTCGPETCRHPQAEILARHCTAAGRYIAAVRCESFYPEGRSTGVGVVVLAGSSGRLERQRSLLLAAHGALAIALGYFGGPGEPPGICEVPLETITAAVDSLVGQGCGRIGLVGVSKGAEAALLVATLDARVDAVIAFAPTSVVWANVGPGLDGMDRPPRSSWTWRGEPLAFVPYDTDWKPPPGDVPAFRTLYEQSLAKFSHDAARATIAVERTRAQVVAIAGGDDQVWPSERFAAEIARRMKEHGGDVTVLIGPDAGHRVVLPGEDRVSGGQPMARGGSDEADAALGERAWRVLAQTLGLR